MQPEIENETDFVAEPHTLADVEGERLCCIVKATFELVEGPPQGADGSFAIAPKRRRRGVRAADVPWGEPEKSSLLFPSDLCVEKPGTDVIVVAAGHAPRGEAVPHFDVGVRLAKVQKVVRVTGARVWAAAGESITEPRPVTSLEIRYDYAFGGSDDSGDKLVEDERNPVGMGMVANAKSLERAPAPQLEDPSDPVRRAAARPKPAGLSAVGRHWASRRKYWGTYDASWLEERCPLPPKDFDPRANQAATPELIARPQLVGGEEGALENLTPNGGTLSFVLPRIRLGITFRVKGREPESFTPAIDTVILDTLIVPRAEVEGKPVGPPLSPLTVELVWRASVRAPRRPSEARIVIVEKRS